MKMAASTRVKLEDYVGFADPYCDMTTTQILMGVFRRKLKEDNASSGLLNSTLLALAERYLFTENTDDHVIVDSLLDYSNNKLSAAEQLWVREKCVMWVLCLQNYKIDIWSKFFEGIVRELFEAAITWHTVIKYIAFSSQMAATALEEGNVGAVLNVFGWCLWWFSGQWKDVNLLREQDINLDTWVKVAGGWSTLQNGVLEKTLTFKKGQMVKMSSFLSQLRLPCAFYIYEEEDFPRGSGDSSELVSGNSEEATKGESVPEANAEEVLLVD